MSIILGVLLGLSLVINGVLIWYAKKLVDKLVYFEENIQEILDMLEDFRLHLVEVNKMERYYGDSTLEGLVNHMKSLEEPLDSFIGGFTWEENNE